MTLKKFSELYNNSRHQNVPEHCRPNKQFKENSANELTKSILAWFQFHKIKAWRQASEGRVLLAKQYTDVLGHTKTIGTNTYIPRSKAAKGIGDICAVHQSKFITLEVKYGKDIQLDVQKKFENEITKAGGIYLIIRNWDSFIFQIEPLLK